MRFTTAVLAILLYHMWGDRLSIPPIVAWMSLGTAVVFAVDADKRESDRP